MATKCKKCDPHEICEECPEWIFTLADLIMCMMGLFVLMWVLKTEGSKAPSQAAAQQAEQQWMKGFQEGFSGYIPTDSVNDTTPLRKINGPGERGKTDQSPESPDGTDEEASIIRPGSEVAAGGRLAFNKGSSALTPETQRSLDQIAEMIRGHRQIVQIKGHTALDDLSADSTPQEKLDLSLRRAQAVADYLVNQGVSPDVVRVQGCSTFEPVVQRDYRQNAQAANRRVEVIATDTLVEEFQDQRTTAKPVKLKSDEKGDH
jgi:chemotaxis protein MotB